MIRINLLSEGRRPVAVRQQRWAPRTGGFDTGNLLLLGLGAAGLLLALGLNFYLGRALDNKRVEVAEAQREVEVLAPIIQEVEEFRAKKAELERKMEIVNDLKANQLGPVRLMDHISLALPELLWLRRMEVGPSSISITGEAFNTNAVANFIENLDRVPEFGEPVLRDTSQRGQIYTFAIDFPYSFRTASPDDEEDVIAAAGG